jgi:hypothetical protein
MESVSIIWWLQRVRLLVLGSWSTHPSRTQNSSTEVPDEDFQGHFRVTILIRPYLGQHVQIVTVLQEKPQKLNLWGQ